jgi:isopentenyl diphosphate isomerase/L-lactate dehydrogenase-like FMN-dependent dehydrogenase
VTEPLSVHDYERLAAERVDPNVWCYFEGGAGDEVTLHANRAAYGRWRFRPRVLVDVADVSTATTVLGTDVALPLLISPLAYQGMLDPEGELATARAAAAAGTVMCVSTYTTRTHGEIAAAAPELVQWAQLYVLRDEGLTNSHIEEAIAARCTAIVLTVDTPFLGRRERDERLGFTVPPELPLPYLRDAIGYDPGDPRAQFSVLSPSVTWRDIEKISSRSHLPVLVKGIVTREDALFACEHGASGIVVSNHGGRQLDGAPATLDALPEVAEAVEGRIPVLLDGGIRRGTDVLKALALGATAAMGGRAPIFGLAAGGESGVRHVLELLQAEIATGLALLGCTRPDQVTRGHIQPAVTYDPPV